jgi:hypothetical protein
MEHKCTGNIYDLRCKECRARLLKSAPNDAAREAMMLVIRRLSNV